MTRHCDTKSSNSSAPPSLGALVQNMSQHPYCFRFTPAEWRHLLEDPEFLQHEDNRCFAPRMLMGVPVQIIPDHRPIL